MKLLIAGDFVPIQRTAQEINSGNYRCLDAFRPIIEATDYSIVNFESPVVENEATKIVKQGPNLKCTTHGVDAVKKAGFKCVTLANNHFYDYGEVGVNDTIITLKEKKIDFVGGGRNIDEASNILYKKINGETLAIINCCEHEFSIAGKTRGGCNPLDPVCQYISIKEAKKKADFVLVIVHGGHEGYQLPSPRMQRTYRFFIDIGADIVINHHQHCYSGYEVYNEKPIFYGLGNFCFDKFKKGQNSLWNEGYAVEIDLNKDLLGYKLHPYIQCAEEPIIKLLQEGIYKKKIDELNEIIKEPIELEEKFKEFCSGRENSMIIKVMSAIDNKYLRKLVSLHLLPSCISKQKVINTLNYIRCESHRDVLLSGIQKKYSKYE